ncbi:hypothetical protein [Streptomyces sp. NBC_01518]|uniref:hypothetical protein n=1 Tax=Streptomyces sp. NBC_01518 TaxID=2903891 RepID=UPI00386FE0BA
MGALQIGEAQGAGDRVQDGRGDVEMAAALQADVVVDADTGELGDLLAPQARNARVPGRGARAASSGVIFARRERRKSRSSLLGSWAMPPP